MPVSIDIVAVLVASIVAYLLGWAWYSKILWQKPWMEARGDDGKAWEESGKKEMPKIMFYGFINTFLMVFVISVFLVLTGASTLVETLQISLLMCFGFVVTLKFNELIYTDRPPHWGRSAQLSFLIDTGYYISLFVVAGAILWWFGR